MCECNKKIDQAEDNRTLRCLAFIAILLFIVVGMASCGEMKHSDRSGRSPDAFWGQVPPPRGAPAGTTCWAYRPDLTGKHVECYAPEGK